MLPALRPFAIPFFLLSTSAAVRSQTLQALTPVISQFEDGPALADTQHPVVGETIFFRFSAAAYKTSAEGRIQLTGHAQAFDSRGTPIGAQDELAVATSLRDEDKDYHPRFHFQFQLPPIAPPGAWRIRYDLTDIQTNQQTKGETAFTVEGRSVPPASALSVRNLLWYRSQDEEAALKVAAYRPGDMVWVRFDVAGYKYGEQNAIDVAYDVAVKSPEGKQIFLQENAAVEKSQAYYPQPWVPGIFSLTLQPTMKPGSYTVSVTARDAVGAQTAVAESTFKVE